MMRRTILVVSLMLAASGAFAQENAKGETSKAERHEFVIASFKTESVVTLPQARVVYGTYGKLNAAKDNAVLLPSHYMADFHGYEWLIGADKVLDPSKLFLVATELFGNGNSSSPSNTPEPYHGPRFPLTAIRDNVEAVHRLLTEELKKKIAKHMKEQGSPRHVPDEIDRSKKVDRRVLHQIVLRKRIDAAGKRLARG